MKRPIIITALLGIIAISMILVIIMRYTVVKQFFSTKNAIYSVPTNNKLVALTYDDGPHPIFTPQILKILEKYHVKATFFMVGNLMKKYPEITKQVASQHAIGNHTYSHPGNMKNSTASQILQELDNCEEVINEITGRNTYLFRPPRGLINTKVLTMAQKERYRTILWTVSADHHDAPYPSQMAKRVLKRIRPGSIILAHDGNFSERWKDVEATPLIIESLLKKGYRFVTIPELLKNH